MKRIYRFYKVSIFLLFTFFCNAASAQFEKILMPQQPEEIVNFKKYKVRAELQKAVDGDKKLNYRARAFDTGGRVVEDITFFRQQYYLYDNKGRVTAYLDSVRKGESREFSEYMYGFTYSGSSKIPAQASLPPNDEVKLEYNKDKKMLTERYTHNDTLYITYYFYDNENRLIRFETYDTKGLKQKRFSRQIASNGRVHMETAVEYIEGGGKDSVVTYYLYDDKMRLAKKQVYTETVLIVPKNDGSKPTHSAKQSFLETYIYYYDDKGRKISEDYEHSIDKLGKMYITWQYGKNGLLTKQTVKHANLEPRIYEFEYVFYK